MTNFFAGLSMFLSSVIWAVEDSRVPGGIALIEIPEQSNPTFAGRKVLTLKKQGRTYAAIGLALSIDPGTYSLKTIDRRIEFTVVPKEYPESRIYLKDDRKVNPTNFDMDRIRAESKKQRKILDSTGGSLDQVDLILPVKGRVSSQFGHRRFFNDQPRKPHSGTDIAAKAGAPIRAAGTGKIVLTDDFFFNGRLVIIDHGEGLKTMYNHLQEINVAQGQFVEQNDIIGTVGSTGRSTGPHLHFGVILNGASVDPKLFVPAIRELPR